MCEQKKIKMCFTIQLHFKFVIDILFGNLSTKQLDFKFTLMTYVNSYFNAYALKIPKF